MHFLSCRICFISLSISEKALSTGTSLDYARIFKQMIHELQRCQTHYPEILTRLVIIKVKMCNARSNVQQLEIHPSLGPVGRKLGPGIQMISSAASHNQRLALFRSVLVQS